MSDNIHFGYFRVRAFWREDDVFIVPRRLGYVSAALIRPPKDSNAPYKIGFSFCSPLDAFSKKLGRKISINRLTEVPIEFEFEGTRLSDAFVAGLAEAVKERKAPNWVVRAFKAGSFKFGISGPNTMGISFAGATEPPAKERRKAG